MEQIKKLDLLFNKCRGCNECGLGNGISAGNKLFDPHFIGRNKFINPPKFMVVAECPSWNEMTTGGFSGKIYNNILSRLNDTVWGLENIYFTHLIKCHSADFDDSHILTCRKFLYAEIKIVNPLLIVAMGSKVHDNLCDGKFEDNLGKIHANMNLGAKIFTTYLPSPFNLFDDNIRDKFDKHMSSFINIINYYLSPF